MKKFMGHGSGAFVPSVNSIQTKEQTHDFLMAHIFFFDPPTFLLSCPQNLNVVRTKLRVSLQKNYILVVARRLICDKCAFLLMG
jgi:hypothetical protein